jgi:leukotriene-A4 hydrolase
MDPNSFANTEQVVTLHSHFDWTVDFDKSKILGSVEHTLNAIIETDRVVLDTSFINIKMITDSQKRPLKVA